MFDLVNQASGNCSGDSSGSLEIEGKQVRNACSTLERSILLSMAIGMSNEEFPKKEMETLWAPWRVEYFEKEPRDRDFLTTAGRGGDDCEDLVITRRKKPLLLIKRESFTVGQLWGVH